MNKKQLFWGMLVCSLTFGLVFVSCDNGTTNKGGSGTTDTDGDGTATQYTVTFDPDGGTVNPTSLKVNSGATVSTLPTPTKSTNTFGGWYTQKNGGGTQFTTSTKVTANITVYAKWTSQSGNNNNGGGTTSKPSAPTGVKATALSSSSISLTWNTVSGAESYIVFWASSADGTYVSFATPFTTSQTASSLSASTTYFFKVKAVNSAGNESDYSSPAAYATTLASGGGGNTGGGETTSKPAAPAEPTAIVSSLHGTRYPEQPAIKFSAPQALREPIL